jgi:hypothetical protein
MPDIPDRADGSSVALVVVVEPSAWLTVPPGTSTKTSAIIINTYLGAVAARGKTALHISVAAYQTSHR